MDGSAIIQRCTANHNGSKCGCTTGAGPTGIFIGGNNIIIQHCVFTDNADPGKGDGGGIDISAGKNILVQYNYSANNNGPGFFTDEPYCADYVVRYNISENDGKCYNYGAFNLITHLNENPSIKNYQVYNNVFYKPGGIVFDADPGLHGVSLNVYNNILIGSKAEWGNYTYGNNCYGGGISAPGSDAHPVNADPAMVHPGTGDPDGYKLQAGSPCLGAGLAISDNGGKDYRGQSVGNPPNIGAHESGSGGSTPGA